MPLKIALVGCGKVADQHISQIKALNTASLVAVCDLEPLMAEQVAVRYDIPRFYSDFDRMIVSEKPDVVHIATPPSSHRRLAMAAIDAGCNLVVEKPLALNYSDTVRILSYAQKHSVKITVGYTHYFDPAIRSLRRLIEDGTMGDPVHLDSFFGYNLHGPFGSCVLADDEHWVRKLPGGLFHNVIDHALNKIMEFLPGDDPDVHVSSWQRSSVSATNIEDFPDELRVVIVSNGVSAYATFSSHVRPMRHSFTYFGTRNTAHLDFLPGTLVLSSDIHLPGVIGRLVSPLDQSRQQVREAGKNVLRFSASDYHLFSGFRHLLSAFYDSVLYDLPVPIPHREIEAVSALTDKIVGQVAETRMVAR